MDEAHVAYGDLDGDGSEDAAVVLPANSGGNGAFQTLAVVLNRDGSPHHQRTGPFDVYIGDSVPIYSVSIANGEAIIHTADDKWGKHRVVVKHRPMDGRTERWFEVILPGLTYWRGEEIRPDGTRVPLDGAP